MKSRLLFPMIALSLLLPAMLYSQAKGFNPSGSWLVTLHTKDMGSLQTVMEIEADNETLTAHSRSGALSDLSGFWKSTLARIFTDSFENGAFLHVYAQKGKIHNDTLELKGKFISAIANLAFDGEISAKTFRGKLLTRSNKIFGIIEGRPFSGRMPLRDYSALTKTITDSIKEKIYNANVFHEEKWQQFFEELNDKFASAQDDVDAMFAFFEMTKNLNTSHIGLYRATGINFDSVNRSNKAPEEVKPVEVTLTDSGFAYMKIRHFGGDVSEIDSAFNIICSKNPANLIIDLRDNPGGYFVSVRVAAHLVKSGSLIGMLVSGHWWKTHNSLPSTNELNNLPELNNYSWQEFNKALDEEGVLTGMVQPVSPVYNGRVYVLVNSQTASAAEPLAAYLKETARAVLVGETTAGYMLSSGTFSLPDGWILRVPVADYFTSNGYRIEGRGVAPDTAVASQTAYETAVGMILMEK